LSVESKEGKNKVEENDGVEAKGKKGKYRIVLHCSFSSESEE